VATYKNELKPWLEEEWYVPPKANGEFVCNMKGVLEVYKRYVKVMGHRTKKLGRGNERPCSWLDWLKLSQVCWNTNIWIDTFRKRQP